jgi:hypothetical protein
MYVEFEPGNRSTIRRLITAQQLYHLTELWSIGYAFGYAPFELWLICYAFGCVPWSSCDSLNSPSVLLRPLIVLWFIAYSVEDPGCLSRIPDPDFYPSRIPDLGSRIPKQQQNRGVKKKIFCHSFLFSHKFHKIEHYFSFKSWRKKFGSIFKELYNFLSGIRKKPIPDPGSRGQKGTGSRIRIRNTDCLWLWLRPPIELWFTSYAFGSVAPPDRVVIHCLWLRLRIDSVVFGFGFAFNQICHL